MTRPYNTLFLLMSLDGKISTGVGDIMDFDRDLPAVCPDLSAYYNAEKETDEWSAISGNIAMKLGAGSGQYIKGFHNCGHVLFDCSRLTTEAVNHIADNCQGVIFVTDFRYHSYGHFSSNVRIYNPGDIMDLPQVMQGLYDMGVSCMTVQTGSTLNNALLRAGLIDRVDIFIAPVIVGGKDTHTLADGESLIHPCQIMSLPRINKDITVRTYPGGMVRYTALIENTVGHTSVHGYYA